MGFFSNILGGLKKASRSRLDIDKSSNTVQFLINSDDEQYFTLTFDNMELKNPHDPSTGDVNRIIGSNNEIGTLYLESIRLYPNSDWSGAPGGCFEIFIRRELQGYHLEFIKSFDDKFWKFSKYTVNGDNEVGLIWFCLNDIELFIFDPKGKLFNDLLGIYNIKNKNLYIENLEEFEFNFKSSVTEMNMIEDFFSKD